MCLGLRLNCVTEEGLLFVPFPILTSFLVVGLVSSSVIRQVTALSEIYIVIAIQEPTNSSNGNGHIWLTRLSDVHVLCPMVCSGSVLWL